MIFKQAHAVVSRIRTGAAAYIGAVRLRQVLSLALILAGTALLAYTAAQYGRMYLAQRELAEQWRQANEMESQPVSAAETVLPPQRQLVRLIVPSIDLDSVIVEGTSPKALLLGPGHLKGSPVPGETGNSVISGHRDTFFRHIHELKPGDSIVVERAGRQYRFEVTEKKIVQPTDIWVINPSKDSRLTLITCYPTYYIGPAPKRLVVFSKLTGTFALQSAPGESARAN